jgi:Spy/CpxP family protein refolding chaperone
MTGMAAAVLTPAAGISMASAADTAATAQAAPPGPQGGHHGPWRLLGKLGLSAAQKQQIKDIMAAAHPQMQSLHEQMMTQRADLRAQVFKVLTPEQQTQLATLEAQARQSRSQKHGGWGAPAEQ